jgi:site-specific DNA-cytosine methylase
LFDGIAVLRCALGDQKVEYFASEIDKYAITVSKKNYPDITHIGDVTKVKDISDVYLLCGGSPCTDLSISKKNRKGLEGEHSKLFWEWVRIWKESKPKYFILENVASMPKKDRDIITAELGVQPIMINASLVSAQNRKRLFWTNINVIGLPVDRNMVLKDILEPGVEDSITQTFTASKGKSTGSGLIQIGHVGNSNGQANRVYSAEGKSVTLSANGGGLGAKTGLYKTEYSKIRKLTPVECERLQSLPDNYTAGISNTQRYRCLGNAFNCEVIKFILSFMSIPDE